jgi:phenylpyruvate tautomerase PptA (4-oxalocrotonate tautomerase family)
VDRKINQFVLTTTSDLKTSAQKVREQTEVVINDIERDISAFQGKRDAEDLAEQKRLEQLRSEIQKILNDSHELLRCLD